MNLPKTTCVFNQEENKLTLVFPLTQLPYKVQLGALNPSKWPQFQEVVKRAAKVCQEQDKHQGTQDGSYYASVELSRVDWQWILTWAASEKPNTTTPR